MLPPAAYRLIHMTLTPSSALQADTTESGIAPPCISRSTSSTAVPSSLLDDLDRLDVAAGLTDRGRHPPQRPGDVGQLDAQQERHSPTLGDAGDGQVSVAQGADGPASRCRSPVARTARRSMAARTSSGEPTTTTRSRARVIAV